jgi:Helix-turn-helix domain
MEQSAQQRAEAILLASGKLTKEDFALLGITNPSSMISTLRRKGLAISTVYHLDNHEEAIKSVDIPPQPQPKPTPRSESVWDNPGYLFCYGCHTNNPCGTINCKKCGSKNMEYFE